MTKILIAEDENIVAWDIKEALEKLGHTVVGRVVSGVEAIQTAAATRPDLVLMDIRLEGDIDGVAAAAEIYNRFHIPVVYLTAYADDHTLEQATATNPFGYLVKPFQRRELHTTIQVALRRYQQEFESNAVKQQFQLNLISQLQERSAQLQQAIAYTHLMSQVLDQVHTASNEHQILQTVIQELGFALDADYCWIALYDRKYATATITYEYISSDQPVKHSAIGIQIDRQRYSRFYRHLLEKQSWLSPPQAILPVPYQSLLALANQMLICPISQPQGTFQAENQQTIGEVGILTTGKPPWCLPQASLISQIISYAVSSCGFPFP